jgi:predicted kinase
MQSNNLYIIVAISRSGKSTWCNSVLPKLRNTSLVSLDEIRRVHPDESSRIIAFKLIDENLKRGNVLFDANNCKHEHRVNLLNNLTCECKKYAIDFNASLDESLINLKSHNGSIKPYVTETIIKRQYEEYLADINKLTEFNVMSKSEFENKFLQ